MNAVEKMQFKNHIERILHVPGNYNGGILEIALVCDYHMPQDELKDRTGELIGCMKMQSEVFRNVRLNVIKWITDNRIIKEVTPMAYVQMGKAFEDYNTVKAEDLETPKTLQELARKLKLFYARSKIVIVLTDGSYERGDETLLKQHLHPFLYRKILLVENGVMLSGRALLTEKS